MYHFLSLWYDATWDWTHVFRAIGEHSTHSLLKENSEFKPVVNLKRDRLYQATPALDMQYE